MLDDVLVLNCHLIDHNCSVVNASSIHETLYAYCKQWAKNLRLQFIHRLLLFCCRFTGVEHRKRFLETNVNTRQILQNMLETTTEAVSLQKLLELRPLIDTSPALSEKEVLNSVRRDVPNLPVDYWETMRGKATQKNKTCAKLPAVYDIKFNNIYWQVL